MNKRKLIAYWCGGLLVATAACANAALFGLLTKGYLDWASRAEALARENEALASDKETLARSIGELERRFAEEKTAADALDLRLAEAQEAEKRFAELAADLSKSSEENSRLKGSSAGLAEQIAAQTANLEAVKAELETARTALRTTRSALEKADAENRRLLDEQTALSAQNASENEELTRIVEDGNAAKANLAEIEKRIQEQNLKLAAA